jgi:internalin A
VPPEILGSNQYENCLEAVRSHFADKAYGVALDREIKLILLGNGRVGKTSLIKRLVQNDFDPCEPSTHGIQLVPWELSDHGETLRINIWDFGGQDIYHGTHTLFLRSRAVFLLVWDRDSAQQPGYDADGFHFEHFPLAYWLDYIRDASPESPVIVVENKCDDGMGTSPSVPVPGAQVHFSAKTGYGRDELTTLIRGACKRELTHAGARAIGVGRWQVKQTLLAYVSDDATRAPEDRQYRTLSYAHFQRLCEAQQGQVTSAYELLRYLHNNQWC